MILLSCKRCGVEMVIPSLSWEEKQNLIKIKSTWGSLRTVQQLLTVLKADHSSAKAIVMHMNDFGKCNRCNFENLEGENVVCPKCKAFNLNWGSE